MKGKCSICGEVIRSRRSEGNSAQSNFLRAVGRHMWKNHEKTMKQRIKAGKAKNHNPEFFPKFFNFLRKSSAHAWKTYTGFQAKQRAYIDETMKTLEPILPREIVLSWEVVKALEAELKGIIIEGYDPDI